MRNVKALNSSNQVMEGRYSKVSTGYENSSEENENIFLIGLDFQGKPNGNFGKMEYDKRSKIPMIMLRIDANKLLAEKRSSEENAENKSGDFTDENNELENSKPIKEVLAYNFEDESKRPSHEDLSFREMQVFKLIALGKTRKQIADQLFLSISTINTYRARILEKMNMKNNSELMRYAFKNKLVE